MSTGWASLAKLSVGGELKETSFDESANKAHFSPGEYKDVTILEVNPGEVKSSKTGIVYPKIRVSVQNDDGAKLNHDIFLLDKEGNMGYGLRNLLGSLTPDRILLMQYGREIQKDLALLASLTGMKVSFTVEAPTEGAEIVSADGIIIARDIKSGEEYGSFETYKAAGEHLKENGIRRGYNGIGKFTNGSDNSEAIKKVLESVGKVSAPKVRRASL
jgi:hypothetical protein